MSLFFLFGGSYFRVPGTFTSVNPRTREFTDQRLQNTYESIHWSARERMSEVDDYDKAGLVNFTMVGVTTEPDSPVVHEVADQQFLPLPGPPGRPTAVQWVNRRLNVSLMEDDMREYERNILKLWGMQQLYTLATDRIAKESFTTENSLEDTPRSAAERLQQLSVLGKRPTADLTIDRSSELIAHPSPRSETF